MKYIFVFINLFFMIIYPLHCDSRNMKITLNTGDYLIVLYEGSPHTTIINALQKAKKIWIENIEKTAIIEGVYIIDIVEGSDCQKYIVQNDYWIYDETNDKFLRCSVLSDLRDFLIAYLIDKH